MIALRRSILGTWRGRKLRTHTLTSKSISRILTKKFLEVNRPRLSSNESKTDYSQYYKLEMGPSLSSPTIPTFLPSSESLTATISQRQPWSKRVGLPPSLLMGKARSAWKAYFRTFDRLRRLVRNVVDLAARKL